MKPIFKAVRFRLTLWYALILTLFLSVFSFLMYSELERALYRDADRNLLHEVQQIEQTIDIEAFYKTLDMTEKPVLGFMKPEMSRMRENLKDALIKWERDHKKISRSTLMIRLESLDHSLLLSNMTGWEKEIIFPDFERDAVFLEKGESFQTIHFHSRPIRLYYQMVTYDNTPLFIIEAGLPIKEIKNTLDRLSFIILISIPGAVAFACFAGWFLAKRSFSPVQQMIEKARQITSANMQGRLPRTQAGDEIDHLAGTLNEMIDRLEASMKLIKDFSSDVSHELKTPLAIIRGEVDLALRRERSADELRQTLKVIEGEVNELIRLVDDLMFLMRSDAKQLHFEKKRIRLEELLKQVCDRFKDRAGKKNIKLELKSRGWAEVEGDEVYLKRLFANLLDNAIKFTPEGGEIDVSLKIKDKTAVAEVKDTGIGIEPGLREKVFFRFYRTDQARSQEGSGLGLNIAKSIVEGHGGKIHLESPLQKGTSAIVTLPLYDPKYR